MSKFKSGDKVTPISVDRYTDRNVCQREEMLGRTLVVRSVHNDEFTSVVFAGFPGEGVWQWHPDDLRLVFETQAQPVPQKPLRRGDLVKYEGNICIVISKDTDSDGDCRIASLTDTPDYFWASMDELTKIGSIRKKVKCLQAQMRGEK